MRQTCQVHCTDDSAVYLTCFVVSYMISSVEISHFITTVVDMNSCRHDNTQKCACTTVSNLCHESVNFGLKPEKTNHIAHQIIHVHFQHRGRVQLCFGYNSNQIFSFLPFTGLYSLLYAVLTRSCPTLSCAIIDLSILWVYIYYVTMAWQKHARRLLA